MVINGLELCGLLVDYCDVLWAILDSHSDGTHSLQRIHWWASDVMLHFSKSVQMNKQTHLFLECPEGEHIFRKCSFFFGKLEVSYALLRMYKGMDTFISPLCIVNSVQYKAKLPHKLLLNQAAFCVCKHHIHLHKERHSPFRRSYFLNALYCPINKSPKAMATS